MFWMWLVFFMMCAGVWGYCYPNSAVVQFYYLVQTLFNLAFYRFYYSELGVCLRKFYYKMRYGRWRLDSFTVSPKQKEEDNSTTMKERPFLED